MEMIVKQFLKNRENIISDNKLIIKYSGDGTNLTKSNKKILNFTMAIINDKNRCTTSNGHYILGIYMFQ